ncbi:Terpene synthase 5 [Euphorbia peplus]|nr:Terpene synthase 5 [Euphorbia peplus]
MGSPTTQLEQDFFRGCLKNLPHCFWGQTFASLAPHDSELESHFIQVEAIKLKVKDLFLQSKKELTENIQFINLLCRLGVSYHFKDEINEQLNCIFTLLPKLLEDNDYNLCTLANLFRVLRQNGYKMTSDAFKKFKDGHGEFKEEIINDIKGILCLYEACFLAIPGEDILDEALAFTRKHLEILAENSNPHLQKHIKTSLMYPSHRTVERVDALHYISFYEKDESINETLLKFAKMDYNGLQLFYRKELALLLKWTESLNIAKNLPFARDRLVESYMWALGCIFEPQYSGSRMLLCKYAVVLTVLDDIYDSYGTIDELRVLTTALQRYTKDAGDELPEAMRHVYKLVFELTENNGPQGYPWKKSYAGEMMKEIAIAYSMESYWQKGKIAPSLDEYTKNGKVTSGYDVLTSVIIVGEETMGMKEIVWLRNNPDIVVGAKLHARFLNDISGYQKDETERGDFPKVNDCYAIQYGVSQEEAIEAIERIIETKWKEMNEDLVKPTTVPMILIKHTLNYSRVTHLYYQGTDLYTYGNTTKPLIRSMLINPIPM